MADNLMDVHYGSQLVEGPTPIKKGDLISASTPAPQNQASTASDTLPSTINYSTLPSAYQTRKVGALQQLSDLLSQNMKLDGLSDFKDVLSVVGAGFQRNIPTIAINDLRGDEAAPYTRDDCVLRRSLAALYRLIDVNGWSQSIYNHISARSASNPRHFLINPFGLLYHEIQASSLITIDTDANVIQQGSTVLSVNKAGWTLHSALHDARPDVNCVIHVHLPDVIAVSCIRAGLLPTSQEATELLTNAGVRYHDYQGIIVNESERATIVEDLGPMAKVLFLRNHGVAVAAASIPEAWYLVKRVVTACQTQVRMLQLSGGASLLADLKERASTLTEVNLKQTVARPFVDEELDGVNHSNCIDANEHLPMTNGKAMSEGGEACWSPADLEFEAQMRVLDSAGFRTGHVYRQPNLLRRAHAGGTWAGDATLADPIVVGEMMTTDMSAGEFSGVDDITAANTAGAEQLARISDHVRSSRQKGVQRNLWLSKENELTHNESVAVTSLPPSGSPKVKAHMYVSGHRGGTPTKSPTTSPMLSDAGDGTSPSNTSSTRLRGSLTQTSKPPTLESGAVANGEPSTPAFQQPQFSEIATSDMKVSPVSDGITAPNKSATLPASARQMEHLTARTTHTLQSADGVLPAEADEKHRSPDKKTKKKRSFRIPSFSLKRKH